MNKVAIYILANGNYQLTKLVIGNLLQKTKVGVDIYVCDFTYNEQTHIYVEHISNNSGNNGWYYECVTNKRLSYGLDFLITCSEARGEYKYTCILPTNYLVGENWLENLIHKYNTVEKSGVISISTLFSNKMELKPLLHNNDTFDSVWVTPHNIVNGLLLYKTDLFEQGVPVKFQGEGIPSGMEQEALCVKAAFAGFNNYYIRGNVAVKIGVKDELLFPKITAQQLEGLKNYISELAKQNYEKTIEQSSTEPTTT